MSAIFLRTIKDRLVSTLVYIIGEIGFIWMYVAIFPSMEGQADELSQAFAAYPESLMKAFGISDMAAMFRKIENFLATENYSFLWPILAVALVVSIGGYSIAGEIERKTIETLLAQPISRIKIFISKYFSGLLIFTVFTAMTVFSIIPLAKIHGVDYFLEAHTKMFVLGLLFGGAIYSMTTLFSALFSERAKTYFFSVGIIIVMYALNIVASLKDNLSDLKYFSFFHYFDTNKALVDNQIDPLAYYIFGGVMIGSTLLAALIFNRRNITVS